MAMINCSECGNKVSDQAITCPHCGIASPVSLEEKNQREAVLRKIEEERIKEEAFEKERLKKKEIENEKDKKNIQNGIVVVLIIGAAFTLLKILSEYSVSPKNPKPVYPSVNTLNNSSYCYDMWYKYGSCVYRSANGLPCKAGTDVIIPSECQNFSGKIEASKAGMLSNK